jgi:translation initiation factor IF-2
METCTVEAGLLKKKPCGQVSVTHCATCEQPLCSKHAIAQLKEGGLKSGKFMCKECDAAHKAFQKNLPPEKKPGEAPRAAAPAPAAPPRPAAAPKPAAPAAPAAAAPAAAKPHVPASQPGEKRPLTLEDTGPAAPPAAPKPAAPAAPAAAKPAPAAPKPHVPASQPGEKKPLTLEDTGPLEFTPSNPKPPAEKK